MCLKEKEKTQRKKTFKATTAAALGSARDPKHLVSRLWYIRESKFVGEEKKITRNKKKIGKVPAPALQRWV